MADAYKEQRALLCTAQENPFHRITMRYATFLLFFAVVLLSPREGWTLLRDIHVEWGEYQYKQNLVGFRLYRENAPVCETTDPSATSMDCTIDAPDGETFFTLTSLFQDGSESTESTPFSYIFSSTLKALITAQPLEGESPLAVSFDASSSTGNILFYDWLFGDGETGSGNSINHTFTSAGSYSVLLKTTDTSGAVDRETIAITVTSPTAANTPPTSVISSSSTVGDAPLQVQFDGSGSSDSDGSIISYKWDLGDGGTATGPQITYTYTSEGTFNASLTVTDDGGLSDSISTPIIVNKPVGGSNKPPKGDIKGSKKRGKKPLKVSFSASDSIDPDGTIQSYSWNFGDGTSGSGVHVNHKFLEPAVYTVTLRVTDNMGAVSDPVKFSVTVLATDQEKKPLTDKIRQALTYILNLLLNRSSNSAP